MKDVWYTYAGSNPQTGPDDRRLSLGYLEYHSEGLHYMVIDCFWFSCGIQNDIKSKDRWNRKEIIEIFRHWNDKQFFEIAFLEN